jgi:hypothetical protein
MYADEETESKRSRERCQKRSGNEVAAPSFTVFASAYAKDEGDDESPADNEPKREETSLRVNRCVTTRTYQQAQANPISAFSWLQ